MKANDHTNIVLNIINLIIAVKCYSLKEIKCYGIELLKPKNLVVKP